MVLGEPGIEMIELNQFGLTELYQRVAVCPALRPAQDTDRSLQMSAWT